MSPAGVTRALLAAVHRAIVHGFGGERALRLCDTVLHPHAQLAYSFDVALGHGTSPRVVIRVAVRRSSARFVADADCAAALAARTSPLSVVAAPLGLRGVLAARSVAGDALAAAVLKRWREAGLLPDGFTDETVVFVRLDDGVEVPFPRAVILTSEPERPPACEVSVPAKAPEPVTINVETSPVRKPWKSGNVALWRSRKRPRSPAHAAATVEPDSESSLGVNADSIPFAPPQKQEDALPPPPGAPPAVEKYAGEAPTAQSLNAALAVALSKTPADPTPVLHHPLADPVLPPLFQEAPDLSDNDAAPVDGAGRTNGTLVPNASKGKNELTLATDLPAKSALSVPPTPGLSQPSLSLLGTSMRRALQAPEQSGNGLDVFLMGNPQDSCAAFESSAGMDMSDFNHFEEDVTDLFPDEDRIAGVENPLLQSVETPRPPSAPVEPQLRPNASSSELLSAHQDTPRQTFEARMDVDSGSRPLTEDPENVGGTQHRDEKNMTTRSTTEVIGATLTSLRGPLPTARPPKETVESTLSSFIEDDLTQRRTARLSATRSVVKRRYRADAKWKRIIIKKSRPILPNDVSMRTRSHSGSTNQTRGLYIPRRMVSRFYKLRRRGAISKSVAFMSENNSDASTSESDEEEDVGAIDAPPVPPPPTKFSFKLEEAIAEGNRLMDDGKLSSNRTDAHGRSGLASEYDPLKIVDSVAVDCASACIVLAAERTSSVPNSSAENSSGLSIEGNGSLSAGRDSDVKVVMSGPAQNGARSTISSMLPQKAQVANLNGSPSSRLTKRDRELYSLLTMLEMHTFSGNELELFADTEHQRPTENVQQTVTEEKTEQDRLNEQVSSAAMRRVLLGLPRMLETSTNIRACFDAFKEDDSTTKIPVVRGPISVSSFLGSSASIFPLSPPQVCLGYDNEWLETSSGAMPLWEKAGLEPFSERKNVEYVAMAPKDLEEDARLFLRDVSAQYEECSYGRHGALPSDSLMLIANAVSNTATSKTDNPATVTEADRKMVEQYHLSITGLCSKLAAVARDKRKKPSGSPTNIVAYVISPFERKRSAANVALMQAVAPLVGTITGTIPVIGAGGGPILNLPAAPWRESPASKSVVSITVRLIMRDVVDRHLLGPTEMDYLLDRPLRPQLMKAVCFAVYSAIRYKRVRCPSFEAEVASVLSRGTFVTDDLMSPMTPEIMGETQVVSSGTPLSPLGTSGDENTGYAGSSHVVDQSSALSPSFLHEPAVVLAGVGQHMGQTEGRCHMVLHLAYTFCETSSRIAFAWTDHRGEMLDTGTVHVTKSAMSASRRRAFWGMWVRGQRWRMSFVEEVHATVSKLGAMSSEELEDWEWVVGKVMTLYAPGGEKKCGESLEKRMVRRFPPMAARNEEISEAFADVPTPATPGVSQPSGSTGNGKSGISMDVKMAGVSSVSVLSVREADTHLFMEKAMDTDEVDRRDFAIVSDISLCKESKSQANAILARFVEDGIGAVEMNVLRHYGTAVEPEEMVDERSAWDSYDVRTIANCITVNFHELRYVACPPSWPMKRWLSVYPVHLEAVRSIENNLRNVYKYVSMNNASTAR